MDINKLLEVMAALRDPQSGCPWDREQTFATIAPYTLEEAYEVADAIDREDYVGLKDELGDLLLQVVYHARMAEEAGRFNFGDVVAAICTKMVRRHPHVFGTAQVADARAQSEAWESLKAAERLDRHRDNRVLDNVPRGLPGLTRAAKLSRRASRVGFDWDDAAGPRAKVDEELQELDQAVAGRDGSAMAAEMGDVLFALVNLCRHLELDPEHCLRGANRRFVSRFERVEDWVRREAAGDWASVDLDQLETVWQRAKRQAE